MKPVNKRVTVILVYAIILAALAVAVFYWIKPDSSCFDNLQNQNEEGVDCGGICEKKCPISPGQNLKILETGLVDSGVAGKTDLYGKIKNDNQTIGSSRFEYELRIKDGSGNLLVSRKGVSFILPGETKYIVENNVDFNFQPVTAEMVILDARWLETNEFYEEPKLRIVNKNYEEIVGGIGFSEARGLLRNESPLDFNKIKIRIILKDGGGKIIALNSTEMNTVKAGENREFQVGWPGRFPGVVGNMEVQPEVNVFDTEAYVKRFFQPEKFQQ